MDFGRWTLFEMIRSGICRMCICRAAARDLAALINKIKCTAFFIYAMNVSKQCITFRWALLLGEQYRFSAEHIVRSAAPAQD